MQMETSVYFLASNLRLPWRGTKVSRQATASLPLRASHDAAAAVS